MPKAKKNLFRKKCPICSSEKYNVIYSSTVDFDIDLNTEIFSARRLPDRIHGTIIRCNQCKLVRTLEVIDDQRLSKLYANSRFTYKNLTLNLRSSYGRILHEAMALFSQRKSFLEIGCGNGFMLEEALKIGFKKVSGIEPSRDAILRANKSIAKSIKQDILHPGVYPKGSFDAIAAFQVFDHIPDPNQFLQICFNLLQPSGILILMNHDVTALSARVLGEKSPIIDIEHTYLYSQKTIQKILMKNGFSVIKVYDPPATLSVRYLLRLLPLPVYIKKTIEKSKNSLLNINISIHPGNLAVIAKKK